MASKIAVYIGRFQPFHLGHAHILGTAMKENDIAIVFVGSAGQAPTIKNPFSADERQIMIAHWFVQNREFNGDGSVKCELQVLHLPDEGPNNTAWILAVQKKVAEVLKLYRIKDADAKITLYGADKDASSWYVNAFPQWDKKLLPLIPEGQDLSATNLRDILFDKGPAVALTLLSKDIPQTTLQFLAEFSKTESYAARRAEYEFIKEYKRRHAFVDAPYEAQHNTVDAVIIQSGHVLVVERANQPGRGLWALPGGFVKRYQTLIEAMVAEVTEETGLRLADGKRALEITKDFLRNNIKAKEIFDDPDRSLRGRTFTVAFLVRLDDTKPLPKVKGQNMPLEETGGKIIVETFKAFWLPLNVALDPANNHRWFEDHPIILKTMTALIKG